MKDTIYESKFCNEMSQYYSYDGAKALFNFLEECDPDMEFDPIGIQCDFEEYNNLKECLKEYDNLKIETIDDLREHTTVIEVEGTDSIIIQVNPL